MSHTNKFDLDLQFGKKYENALQRAVEGTNECKSDRIWHRTGNVYIEVESRGKPSGINVTTAKYWCFCLHSKDRGEDDQIWLLIPTHLLKEFVKDYPIKNGGDNYTSKGHVVPAKDLIDFQIQQLKFHDNKIPEQDLLNYEF